MLKKKEIRLSDYIRIVWKHRLVCCLIVLSVTCGAIAYSYRMPKSYRVETIIIPISSGSASGAIPGLLSSLPLVGGGAGGLGDPANLLTVYMESRAMRIRLVRSLNLLSKFSPPTDRNLLSEEQRMNRAADALGGFLTVEHDRLFRQKLKLSVVSEDPEFATLLLRQYLVELQNFISDNVLTEAKRQRLFLEKQLAKNKEELLEIGKMLASFYGRNPVSTEQAKINVPVAIFAEGGTRGFKDYEEFKRYFEKLQKEETQSSNEPVKYVKDVPHQIYLKYLTTQQAIIEGGYASLFQALEATKLEEAKQEIAFQILDEPVKPLFHFSPNRRKIAKNSFGISLLISLLYVFCREFFASQRRLEFIRSKREELVEEVA